MDDDELTRRALGQYFRYGERNGYQMMQPSGDSGVEVVDGVRYVELHNGGGTLAVYRVENDGPLDLTQERPGPWLRWLSERDWPDELREL